MPLLHPQETDIQIWFCHTYFVALDMLFVLSGPRAVLCSPTLLYEGSGSYCTVRMKMSKPVKGVDLAYIHDR